MNKIQIQALTTENFKAFGDVVSSAGSDFFYINDRHTERYHALAEVQSDTKVGISIFKNIKASQFPIKISMLERHPLGSQAFIGMHGQQFVVVVAENLDQDKPNLETMKAFITDGTQGVNYHAGTWHHPLITLEAPSEFIVIDRIGEGKNCDVYQLEKALNVET
ncbi:ureidoglycolate lyase [Acinetobacter ursingii]|jgi:ureidoglycolate lyase|uniref:Ureidoglycolate lyase n=1 Tax=Acinetobacter haemolyticus ATCC 19194 TaxID=707232 RepID=D4XKD2_ACIHA|nr:MULTISPECIES: ureidoglycolate lyase [Acinetobacter]EFF84353.1 ureidoglycolate lyase [Acinetobacter haemolyticus ATCC 19194]MDH2021010.1 ureidoglycolate lyase [Acinetobacter ursingii]MDH2073386.1 ureidoglycolate lyase [Acinetobacter ursingii]